MSKPANTMRKGRIEFYDELADTDPPREPDCDCSAVFYQRIFEHGHEHGGWWAILVTNDGSFSDVKGPFQTQRKAERVAREWAEQENCVCSESWGVDRE